MKARLGTISIAISTKKRNASRVSGGIQEDTSDDGVSCRLITVNAKSCSADGLHREEDGHADDRGHEQVSASETFDHGGRGERPDEIPDL